MKAKTMLGLIACASACVSLSAFANTTNDWFDVTVAGENVSAEHINYNNVGSVAASKITLNEVEKDSALVLTPDSSFAGTNRNDGIYVVTASVALTPSSTNDFMDANVGAAKAGIVVGFDESNVTSYYGYASGAVDKWVKLDGAAVVDPGQDTTFAIVLNYRDSKVNFMIRKIVEETPVDTWFGPYDMAGGASALEDIKVWGTGSVSSVAGGFEVAEAEYDGNRYGSVAEAMAVVEAGSGTYNSIAVVDENGTAKSTDDPDDNGLMPWQNKAMGVEDNAQVALVKAASNQNANQITLAANLDNKEDGVKVQFYVYSGATPVGGPYDEDNIQIPMGTAQGTATYTIVPVITTNK